MSLIPTLGKDKVNLPNIIAQYEEDLPEIRSKLEIKGRTITAALHENVSWYQYVAERAVQLKTLVDYLELHINKVKGRLFKSYTETYSRDISDRAKDKYIDNEPAYLKEVETYLEVRELYQQYQTLCTSFENRGHTLRHITNLKVAQKDLDML